MGRERHIKTQAGAVRGWEAVKEGTVPPDALLANGLQGNPKCFFVFLRTVSLLATARQVHFRITSLGGLGQLEQEERIWKDSRQREDV